MNNGILGDDKLEMVTGGEEELPIQKFAKGDHSAVVPFGIPPRG